MASSPTHKVVGGLRRVEALFLSQEGSGDRGLRPPVPNNSWGYPALFITRKGGTTNAGGFMLVIRVGALSIYSFTDSS